MMNNKVSFTNSNNPTISLSAVIYFPPKFDETRQYQAIVLSHPGGGVKEQTAGTYAKKLAEKGFVTIAYDASYQGESGGEPRQLENPYIRTEDISAVIDYLTTLSYVDNTRIGAMGICAGAGYTANAAIQDRRIISSGEYAIMPLAPMKESDAPNEELRQAWEYYHTPRAQYPTAPGYATLRSLNQIITYDAYHMAEVYLTQPTQIVAGSQAGSKWMSDDLYDRASSQDKRYHIVEGANHMDLYDGKAYVAEAISVLAPFFEETL
ncbi:alpha/beta hydrolase [Escherichia coli]|uniref:alpha/beta hydrolase n=1 Tax=Escherichia coli TaxID=562 RepID=UPI000EFDA2F9|nr:alpha/beta hydrolase [Escherichia coli]AYP02030.1 alpha/beta hydrolase [Escherichia coli]EFE1553406.1 alpha/beta hydrolase [Escherichia coli]EIH3784756.1 alpha/beta hydrolase [Escherichia coli]MDM1622408.1 alpha/beta hydrolase [Escherichia coli]